MHYATPMSYDLDLSSGNHYVIRHGSDQFYLLDELSALQCDRAHRWVNALAVDPRPAAWLLATVHSGSPRAVPPGGFFSKLLDAALHADQGNLQLIGEGFPAVAAAVSIYHQIPRGVELLGWLLETEEHH